MTRETMRWDRTFANARARTYTRDDLTVAWCRLALSANLKAMEACIRSMSRDAIIDDLRDEVRRGWGGNGIRAAYIAERLARLRDRALVRQMAIEISARYDTPEIVGIRTAA